jgi:hypothetical protein
MKNAARSGRAIAVVALLVCLLSPTPSAIAQGASSNVGGGGFLGELRNVVTSPQFGQFIRTTVGSRLGNRQPAPPYYGNANRNFVPYQGQPYPSSPNQSWPYQSSPYQGTAVQDFSRGNDSYQSSASPTAFRALVPSEARALGRYDISVLIDRSGSMTEQDCPSPYSPGMAISRWDWCREQTSYLARETSALSRAITIVPFSSRSQRYENARPSDIHGIFSMTSPGGGTNLAGALQEELEYYQQGKAAGVRTRPLMIAVISDGVPSSKASVKRAIIDATRRMTRPDEIQITFLQVGTANSGNKFLAEVDHELMSEGATADIVSARDFRQVMYAGLPSALASSLSDRRY